MGHYLVQSGGGALAGLCSGGVGADVECSQQVSEARVSGSTWHESPCDGGSRREDRTELVPVSRD